MNEKSMTADAKFIQEIFYLGVDYGQLLMEEEREGEERYDAGLCVFGARKFCVPTLPAKRRRIHSEQWIKARRDSLHKFLSIYGSLKEAESTPGIKCDRCGKDITHEINDKGGNCAYCWDNLCAACAGEWDGYGECEKCQASGGDKRGV